jgi:hypothetical protein
MVHADEVLADEAIVMAAYEVANDNDASSTMAARASAI